VGYFSAVPAEPGLNLRGQQLFSLGLVVDARKGERPVWSPGSPKSIELTQVGVNCSRASTKETPSKIKAAFMSSSLISPQGLSFLWLEITAKCNLECGHCYAESGPRRQLLGEMSTQEWLQIMAESSDLGCRHVQFIGGEPTLHPDLSQMISYAAGRGYSFIEIFTNATQIDDELMQAFVKYQANVAISFYSSDPVIHDAITKRRGSFNRTVENIKRMVAAGVPLRAGIIKTALNSDDPPSARAFLESLGVREIKIDIERGVGRGSPSQKSCNKMAELCGECWKDKLCVTSSAKAYPCVFSRFIDLGSVKRGIQTVLESDPLRQFRTALKAYRYELDSCDPINSKCPPDTFRSCEPASGCSPALAECVPHSACAPYRCSPLSACGPSDD
jgi:pyruvate-formate lyase-activating enzyme